jgi:hypothetical protein
VGYTLLGEKDRCTTSVQREVKTVENNWVSCYKDNLYFIIAYGSLTVLKFEVIFHKKSIPCKYNATVQVEKFINV